MPEKHIGSFSKAREKIRCTEPERFPVILSEIYGIELLPEITYSSAEIVRAQENVYFGKQTAEAFQNLMRLDKVSVQDLLTAKETIQHNLSSPQQIILDAIFEDLRDVLEQTNTSDEIDVLHRARTYLEEQFGIGKSEAEIVRTSFGAMKVFIHDATVWEALVERFDPTQKDQAKFMGGFVASATRFASEEYKQNHKRTTGQFIFLNASGEQKNAHQAEQHEMTHWFYHQVFAKHEHPRYDNEFADTFFIEVKNELLAYACGESWQSSLSYLLGRNESGADSFKSFVEYIRYQEERTLLRKKYISAGLLPKETGRLPDSPQRLSADLETYRRQVGINIAEARKQRSICNNEAYQESLYSQSAAATELQACLRQIARLEVQGSLAFNQVVSAVLGAQSFKELAYVLFDIDRIPSAYDVGREFEKMESSDLDWVRVDHILVPAKKYLIPILRPEILIEKIEERIKQLAGFSSRSLEEDCAFEELQSILEYWRA